MNKLSALLSAIKASMSRRRATRIIGISGGVAAFFISIITWLAPDPLQERNDPRIHGRWLCEYEYPDSVGTARFRGITEYFENNTYRYSGHFTHASTRDGVPASFTFRIDATGEWQGNNERIVIKLTDLRSILISAELAGSKLTDTALQLVSRSSDIKGHMPMGLTERYEITHISARSIHMRTSDLQGRPMTLQLERTDRRIP